MLLVKSCCRCISLRTGTIVVGSYSLIASICSSIALGTQINSIKLSSSFDEEKSIHPLVYKISLVSYLIYLLARAIAAGLMIRGALKRISNYMFPWLVIHFVGITCILCVALAAIIVGAVDLPTSLFFAIIIVSSLCATLLVHLWLVVYSYYKELVAEKIGHQTRQNDGKVTSPQINPYHNV